MRSEFLWSQKYRPETVNDLVLPEDIKETLSGFIQQGDLTNFLFHSQSGGTGKTSAALAIANELKLEVMMINASEERSIDVIRTKMADFSSTKSFDGRRKMMILDEADHLPDLSQNALRNFFEKYSSNCCFVMTANQAQRIIPPLQSRCAVIHFNFPKEQRPALAKTFFKRICDILDQENISYDKKLVQHVVMHFFPDFRRCINEIQRYSATGTLSEKILTSIENENITVLMTAIKEKKFQDIRKFVLEKWHGTEQELYRAVYDELLRTASASCLPEAILILSKYGFESTFAVDKEIHSVACMIELMMLPCEFE